MGNTWTKIENVFDNYSSISCLACKGSNIFVGLNGSRDGGVYRSSDNGNSWKQINNGLTRLRVDDLVVKDNILFTSTDCGVYKSNDKGESWIRVLSISNCALAVNSSSVFAAGSYNDTSGVYRSLDNGSSWNLVGLISDVQVLTENETTIFAGTQDSGAYRSTDNGNTWTQINTGLNIGCIFTFAINGTTLFAGGQLDNNVYRSINNGDIWTQHNTGSSTNIISALSINNNIVFAGTGGEYQKGEVYRSLNNGDTWDFLDSSLSEKYGGITDFEIYDSIIIVGSHGRKSIYRSFDNGLTWEPFNDGLPYDVPAVLSLAVDSQNIYAGVGFYFATGLQGSGVWRRPLSEITPVINFSSIKQKREIYLKINPCISNNKLKIIFKIPYRNHVSIRIYNLTGKLVAMFSKKLLSQSEHTLFLKVENLASGKYLCQLHSCDFSMIKPFFIIKK